MSYLLCYSPGAASMPVHWMLIEMGIPFETRLVDINVGNQHDPEYLRLNPSGRVPTLVVDGTPRHESAALLMLLAERHPEAALAPEPGSAERAAWLELMIYLANTLLPAMRDWFYADVDGEPAGSEAVQALARRRIEETCDRFNAELADGREYLVGGKLSTADFLAVVLMRWTRNMPRPALGWPHLARYIRALRARPAFIELNAREGLTEWRNQDD
ncbi:glutathione S-transferase family protein [Paraburkholderia fungorum]|uniref:Glutathione S-transferase n=1 Tax=Paraburkholderia fungorum TaxID=134537 RepID=A0A3R7EAM2_9BURK|nr:glutathione S-transferase family protein [Paraburkholderia fungorum]RKF50209.1 glutathione S-transferase [Paraburkholderia fungorum]